jgi:Resolvase, N terminal domain.
MKFWGTGFPAYKRQTPPEKAAFTYECADCVFLYRERRKKVEIAKIYGYIRVSSRDQNEARQVVALKQFGVPDNQI